MRFEFADKDIDRDGCGPSPGNPDCDDGWIQAWADRQWFALAFVVSKMEIKGRALMGGGGRDQ